MLLKLGIIWILQITISSQFGTDRLENTNERLATSGDNLLLPYAYLDAKSCRCLPATVKCNVAVVKSSSLGFNCPLNHHYCCDSTETVLLVKTALPESNDTVTANRPKIHIRLASEGYEESRREDSNPKSSEKTVSEKPQMRCHCRAREDCEDRYTDYTFGYHCSYDKVRCCEAQDQIERGLYEKSGGRVISIQANNQALDTNDGYQCHCVSSEKCVLVNFNVVQDGIEVQCPYGMVKCCGVPMDKKSDTNVEPDMIQSSRGAQWIRTQPDTTTAEGAGVNIHGQPGFRQPIQLPVLKIPVNDSATVGFRPPLAEVVNSPPELPYSYEANGHYASAPPIYQTGPQRLPIYQYYGNVGSRPNPAPIMYRYNNINSPPQANERSHEPSFLDKVSNFFFG